MQPKAPRFSSSERKKRRLAALEAKSKKSAPQGPHEDIVSLEVKAQGTSGGLEPTATGTNIGSSSAPPTGELVAKGSTVYSQYKGTVELFPWIEDDGRRLRDVTQELLGTNPRCARRHVSGVLVDKMKEKTLLLDNPDVKRRAPRGTSYVKNAGIRKATRKELKELGALNVNEMSLTYNDALILHRLWKEYRDSLLESTVSKKDYQERLYTMDMHGAYVVFRKMNNCITTVSQDTEPVSGIIVADTETTIHVIDSKGKYRIASKKSSEYCIEISTDHMITIMPPAVVNT